MDNIKFGEFIAELRKEKNLTQAELASKLSVTDKAVSKWECGLGFPDIKIIEPLAEALDVSVLDIVQSKKNEDDLISHKDASQAIEDTIIMVKEQQKLEIKNVFVISSVVIFVILLLFIMFAGRSIGEQAYYRYQPKDGLIAVTLYLTGWFLFGLLVSVLAGRPLGSVRTFIFELIIIGLPSLLSILFLPVLLVNSSLLVRLPFIQGKILDLIINNVSTITQIGALLLGCLTYRSIIKKNRQH